MEASAVVEADSGAAALRGTGEVHVGLLTDGDKAKIETAVRAAEARTAGEIVVAVTPSSDSYAGFRLAAAGALAVALGMLTFRHVYVVPGWVLFLAQIPTAIALHLVFGWAPLVRMLVPANARSAAVDARAKAYFLDGGVLETRDRSGVLVFLSERERRVEILADRGIHERVDAEEWQRNVDMIVKRIREHSPAEGLVQAVERIGELLATNFPPRADDTNELPDAVRDA